MMKALLFLLMLACVLNLFAQGIIEADTVKAAHIGDGSRLINLPIQNLAVSASGDTLFITEGNFVIIPGLSASNSGNSFANAGPDIVNACETSFYLNANPLVQGTTGLWSILSGAGGSLINPSHPNATFIGQEGESYLLQWTVHHGGGSSSFDQLNISIAVNTQTSVANAGQDLFAIMTQSVVLNGNTPEPSSSGRWEILTGTGGLFDDHTDPTATFTGVPGQSYTLRWQHYNDCSVSSDELTLTFNESAAGVPSSNGRYYIPDPKFRQYLQIAYPAVMDGDSLIVALGHLVKKIRITNLDVSNLDGIQYLTDFVLFEALQNYDLTTIPYLSDSLAVLRVNSSLAIIPNFPPDLDTLEAYDWNVVSLPDFSSTLKFLKLISLNQLTSIPSFPAQIEHLELRNLGLVQDIPTIPNFCKKVDIRRISHGGYYDELLQEYVQASFAGSLNIPSMTTEFSASNINGLDNFPILPIDKTHLFTLELQENAISEMPSLYDFTNLDNLYLHNNQLLKIDSLPFALQNIGLDGNPIICVENKPPLVEDQLADYDICPEN